MSPWKVILATMVIFGCGVVTGGLLMRTAIPVSHTAEVPPAYSSTTNQPGMQFSQFQRLEFLNRMRRQLALSGAQYDQIEKIMKDSQARTRQLWNTQFGIQMRDEYKKVREDILQVLDPVQRKEMIELLHNRPRNLAGERPVRPPPNSPASTNGS